MIKFLSNVIERVNLIIIIVDIIFNFITRKKLKMLSSVYTLGLSVFGIIYPSIDSFLYSKIYSSKKFSKEEKMFVLFFSLLFPLFILIYLSLLFWYLLFNL